MPYIKISFYNQEHQRMLKNSPKYDVMENLVKDGFTCSNEDLWTYSLFVEQKPFDGYRNFQELKYRLPRRWERIEDYFVLDNHTVRAKFPNAKNQQLTEDLGVGVALALISHIHGLTQADWNIIPVTAQKDLDFSINPNTKRLLKLAGISVEQQSSNTLDEEFARVASDGERFVEVEAKGSYVEVDTITSAISSHKRDVELKKKTQRAEKNSNNILYGVITSYSAKSDVIAHSRILDPPAVYSPDDDPRKLRLLSRLNFYLDKLNLISRANYLIALANRIVDIAQLSNYEALDSRFLVNQRSERFEIPSSYTRSRTELTTREGIGVGEVFPTSATSYFFFGIDLAIPGKLIEQTFSEIIDYRCSMPRSFSVTVDAKIKIQELDLYRIDYSDLPRAPDRTRVIMPLSGLLHSNSAGIIWGRLSF